MMASANFNIFLFSLTVIFASLFQNAESVGKVVCYYNNRAAVRKDLARVTAEELKPAVGYCNYLIYGYIGLDDDKYKAKSLEKDIDLEKGKNQFRAFNDLKRLNPSLKTLISVGGFADSDVPEKYLKALESTEKRGKFVSSVVQLARDYNFDGVDLAWQFPIVKEKKDRSTLGSIWHSIKSVVKSSKDDKEKEHKDQFTLLCKELSAALRGERKFLTLTILPHTRKDAYYDGAIIKDAVEQIHLMTYDFKTPERTPEEADHSAPIQFVYGRAEDQNIEAQVKWWLEHGVPAQKLIIAIPTFGRTWKMTREKSGKTGYPPVKVDGAGEPGPLLKMEGVMAYFEICPTLTSVTSKAPASLLRRIPDQQVRQGTYAYREETDSVKGLWVSYEDPEFAAKKAQYARLKGLGGVAVVDLTLDDYKGSCDATQTRFPILRAAQANI